MTIRYLIARLALAVLKRTAPHITPKDRRWLMQRTITSHFCVRATALVFLMQDAVLAWKNHNYDIAVNGEGALLRRLVPFRPNIVLDVGANVGDWSKAAAEKFPDAQLHAFEIVPETATALQRNLQHLGGRLHINAYGLSDRDGCDTVYTVVSTTERASLNRAALTLDLNEQITPIAVKTITGDVYLREHGIDHVDLLKIDVEGAEMSVLRSFNAPFRRGAIDMVQFEYGAINLTTRHFLADFQVFFEQFGLQMGKVYPEAVLFKSYETMDEDFIGPVYVACRRMDIIDAVRVR